MKREYLIEALIIYPIVFGRVKEKSVSVIMKNACFDGCTCGKNARRLNDQTGRYYIQRESGSM